MSSGAAVSGCARRLCRHRLPRAVLAPPVSTPWPRALEYLVSLAVSWHTILHFRLTAPPAPFCPPDSLCGTALHAPGACGSVGRAWPSVDPHPTFFLFLFGPRTHCKGSLSGRDVGHGRGRPSTLVQFTGGGWRWGGPATGGARQSSEAPKPRSVEATSPRPALRPSHHKNRFRRLALCWRVDPRSLWHARFVAGQVVNNFWLSASGGRVPMQHTNQQSCPMWRLLPAAACGPRGLLRSANRPAPVPCGRTAGDGT